MIEQRNVEQNSRIEDLIWGVANPNLVINLVFQEVDILKGSQICFWSHEPFAISEELKFIFGENNPFYRVIWMQFYFCIYKLEIFGTIASANAG